nr:uncharacterized protein LOC113803590 [Penaeus vannamei]
MRCAIIRQGFPGRPLCLTQPLPDATRVTVGVVVPALVLLVAAASFCVVRKMSARNAAVLAEAEEARMLSSRTKKTELLVIHAREPLHPLHHVHTLRLMDQLRGFCNARVHDIWDHRDPYRLQDPNGWLQRVLSCGSDGPLVVCPRASCPLWKLLLSVVVSKIWSISSGREARKWDSSRWLPASGSSWI